MEYLGSRNLFSSHFIVGVNYNNKKIKEVDVFHKWLDYKDSDYGMQRYNSERTQSVSFLHIIDLTELKTLLHDLIVQYKKSYPYSTKEDFVEHCFSYTLYVLKKLICTDFTWLGDLPNEDQYTFYYHYNDLEFEDYVISDDKDIEYYIQYYKKVIEMIENLDFESLKQEFIIVSSNTNDNKDEFTDSLFYYIFPPTIRDFNFLKKKYLISSPDLEYIINNYRPIIEVQTHTIANIERYLSGLENKFIEKYKRFNIDLFKREFSMLDTAMYHLEQFIDILKRGKCQTIEEYNTSFFYKFTCKYEEGTRYSTLLISEKDTIELELYFTDIYNEFKTYIIGKTENINSEIKINKTIIETNSYLQIFSDNDFKLFEYLNEHYTIDNNSPKAKYSYIYHYMKYESIISGTQKNYIDFIYKEYKVKMSKVLPKQYKYEDEIKPLLGRFKSKFYGQND